MRIKTQADVDALDQRIQNELGITLSNYINEEVTDRFADLVILPVYILGAIWKPLIASLFVFILGFWVIPLIHVEYFLYGIIGILLCLFFGLLIGILILMLQLKADLHDILMYSYEILRSSLNDLNRMSDSISIENKTEVITLLFKGVIHIVTIPIIARVVSKKIPLVGGLLKRFIKRVLSIIASLFKIDIKKISHIPNEEDQDAEFIASYNALVQSASAGTTSLILNAFNISIIPLVIVLSTISVLIVVLIWLLW